MGILKEEKGQSSAEYIILFGGVIMIVVVAAGWYSSYLHDLGNATNNTSVKDINDALKNLTAKFQ